MRARAARFAVFRVEHHFLTWVWSSSERFRQPLHAAMVTNRQRVFIVGVGCTAFTKVSYFLSANPLRFPLLTLFLGPSPGVNDKPMKYDVLKHDLHFVILSIGT